MGHAVLHNNALFCVHCHAYNFIKDVSPWRIDRYVTIDVLMWARICGFWHNGGYYAQKTVGLVVVDTI